MNAVVTTATETLRRDHRRRRGGVPARAGSAMRRCLASGEIRPKSELIRFALSPDGQVVPDVAGKLPGRGFWLLPRRDMIDKACARRLFDKAAQASVDVPPDLAGQVEGALRDRCLGLIGLARRSGVLTAGYEKARTRLSKGQAAVLIEALDGAVGGQSKMKALAHTVSPGVPIIALFSAAELGRALGRESAVHVVLAPGRLAERFLAEAGRYAAARDGAADQLQT